MAKKVKKSAKKARRASAGRSRGSAGLGKDLVIVESPAKAKTINRYLGPDYVVKASMGHVRDLPARQMGVDVENRFKPAYEPLAGRTKVLAELKRYAAKAEQVFLATDLDREGEAIAWHLAESLGGARSRIRRVVFNEITASAIREAFEHPRDLDMDKVNAQQARRILDRIVGYEISPLLWRKVAPGLSAGRVQSVAVRLIVDREREIEAFIPVEHWKIGGIFTPDAAAADGLSKDWASFLAATDEKGNPPTREAQVAFLGQRGAFQGELLRLSGEKFHVDDADRAIEIARAVGLTIDDVQRTEDPGGKGPAAHLVTVVGKVDRAGPGFTVGEIKQRDSTSRPPAPFTTAALQQAASIRLGFSATRTMRTAQGLYEGVEVPGEGTTGVITYMRTDSRHLSAEAIGQARDLIGDSFGDAYLPGKPNYYSSGERAQEAHEAIRPTDPARLPENLKAALTADQFKLYRLIWERFIACQMAPARWKVTEADIVANTALGEAVFKAVGRTLEFDGFMRVAGLPRSTDQILPPLAADQAVTPVTLSPTQHFTQPPPRYTEASLVKALEADGIGRPSTYANIIQTVQDRRYVELENKSFRPTDLGVVVNDKLVQHFPDIFDVRFTAHMEDELDRVEEAEVDWVAILQEFYDPFSKDLAKASEEMVHAKAEATPSDYTCAKCGKPMVYRFSKNGRYLACTGYPDCDQTNPVDRDGKLVERKVVDLPCPQCGSEMVVRRSRYGVFLGCTKYPKCKGTAQCDKDGNALKVVKADDLTETCEQCGSPMAVKFKGRRAFLACTAYPECKATRPLPEGITVEAPPKPEPTDAGVGCPKCGRPMLIRHGPRGEFLACSGFPKCRNAMSLDKLDELKAMAERGEIPKFNGDTKAAKSKTRRPVRRSLGEAGSSKSEGGKSAKKKAAKSKTRRSSKSEGGKTTKKSTSDDVAQ